MNLRIERIEVAVTSPGRNFVLVKVFTNQDGLYGVGDGTLNGRELAVATALREHIIPLLLGKDPDRIEDTWQYVHRGTYWRGGQWLGIGAGAHGHWHGRRWWNVRSPQRYIAAALSGAATTAGFELPDAEQRRVERLMMGLRTTEGVARADVAPLDDAKISHLVAAGLLTANDQRIALTADGMRLASAVIVSLV